MTKHEHLKLGPRDNTRVYDNGYYFGVRKPKQVAIASMERPTKTIATKNIRESTYSSCRQRGFEDCCDARTDPVRQKELEEDGQFFRWLELVSPDKPSGLTVLGVESNKSGNKSKKMRKYMLELNRKYGSGEDPDYQPWALVKESDLPDAGYGMFSLKRLEPGDAFGVYMGRKTTPEEEALTHAERPYLMKGVANAEGGIGSGKPILLGMHLINDPQMKGKPKSGKKVNLRVHTDGLLVACRRINVGDEVYFSYGGDD